MKRKQSLIVVPCYNEAVRLSREAFFDFILKNPHSKILFVNDGSTDNTENVLDQFVKLLPAQISCMNLPKNQGKAEAIRQGFMKGLALPINYIGYIDADLAAPLSSLLELEKLLDDGQKEIALGARVLLLGHDIRRNPIRYFVGRLFATVVSIALRLPVYDTQCGVKLFKKTDRLKKVFSFPFMARWIFDVEILARFIALDRLEGKHDELGKISIEHPLQSWDGKKGSKLKISDYVVSFFDLIRILRTLYSLKNTNNVYRRKLLASDL